MAGLSVRQISNFLSLSKGGTRELMHRQCNVTHNKDGEQRIEIREFVRFLVCNPKRKAIFERNYTEGKIEPCYQLSAKIVYDHVKALEDAYAEGEVQVLKTDEIFGLPFNLGLKRERELNELCIDGTLAAYKNIPEKWGTWRISVESFALYLFQDPALNAAFLSAWLQYSDELKVNDVKRYRFMHSIKNALNRVSSYHSEMFTPTEVSELLDVPKNQVEATFCSGNPWIKKFKLTAVIPAVSVAKYLETDKDRVAQMYDRWAKLQKEDDPFASKLIHMLMIYEYYTRNKEN